MICAPNCTWLPKWFLFPFFSHRQNVQSPNQRTDLCLINRDFGFINKESPDWIDFISLHVGTQTRTRTRGFPFGCFSPSDLMNPSVLKKRAKRTRLPPITPRMSFGPLVRRRFPPDCSGLQQELHFPHCARDMFCSQSYAPRVFSCTLMRRWARSGRNIKYISLVSLFFPQKHYCIVGPLSIFQNF